MRISDLAAGVVMGDRYRLIDIRGRGGFGDVWRAVRLVDGKEIALKIYHEQERGNRVLFQEAQQARRFQHRRLVRVFDAGRVDGIYCMEMEFVAGPTLSEKLGNDERPLYISVMEAMQWMVQVAEGLAYLHSLDPPVSHGDVKPDNLVLSPGEGVKLMDFGHSRQIEDQFVITNGGGTWLYMAPEVYGRNERHISSDIYSFGVVFYRVLTGRFPRQTLGEVLNLTPFPRPTEVNSAIPAELDELIVRCLERSPVDRFPSGSGLLDRLQGIAESAGESVPVAFLAASVAPSPSASASDYLDMAHRFAAEGDFEGALKLLDKSIGQISTNRRVLLLYAHVAEKCGRREVARRTFERLVGWMENEGIPANEQREARERLGSLQIGLKDIEGAVGTFEYLHNAFPDDPWYAFRHGIALGLAAQFEESIAILEEVRGQRPDLACVPAKIGFAHLQLKRPRVAAQYFNEALMLDEYEPHALYHLAIIRYVEGRQDSAMTYFRRLKEANGEPVLSQDLAHKLGVA